MKKVLTTAVLMAIIFSPQIKTFAASEDNEISIMAAEQRTSNEADVTISNDNNDIETFNNESQQPQQQEDNSIQSQSNNDAEQNQNNSRDTQSENQNKNQIVNPDVMNTNVPEMINADINAANLANKNNDDKKVNENKTNESDIAGATTEIGEDPKVGLPNPIVTYSNFNDAAKKVGYIPLYIPRKSGYTMNYIAVIGGDIVEIRYGRRWEPNVVLSVRTYKRPAGEQLKDISGVNGVKWKIDTSSDTTIYIARISDNSSVAVWAVGQYTFAAMVENLSFAAFHSLIVEELVDLCNHYFIDL